MLRGARVWRQLFKINLIQAAEYRASFGLQLLEGLVQLVVTVATFALIFRFTDDVAGWSRGQVLMLAGIYRAVEGLVAMLLLPNMYGLAGCIRSGDLDYLLLRPVSSQFLVSTRVMTLPEIWNVAIGILLAVFAGRIAGVHPTAGGVAASAVLLVSGLVLTYSVFFFAVTWCFWLVTEWLTDFIYAVFGAGKYPVTFFRGTARTVLTLVVPVAFVTTFPTEALLGRVEPRMLAGAVAFAGAGLLATNRFWTFAVKRYSSASS